MPELRRLSDGAGDCGAMSKAVTWNEDGSFKEVVGHRPVLGSSMIVGSAFPRTYSEQDFWQTTEIVEIIMDTEEYVKFRTENSVYEWFE